MDHASRAAVVGVLLVATFAMGVYYGSAELHHWPYPHEDELATGYEPHVGERTLLSGTVESVDPRDETARIIVDADAGEFAMTVTGVDASVEPGGTIQVYGTLQSDQEIRAERNVVVEPSSGSAVYKYVVSLVGATLVLAAFFRRWEIDRESLSFTPR